MLVVVVLFAVFLGRVYVPRRAIGDAGHCDDADADADDEYLFASHPGVLLPTSLWWLQCVPCRKDFERAIDCADRALALSPNLETAQKLIVSCNVILIFSSRGAVKLLVVLNDARTPSMIYKTSSNKSFE